MVEETAGRAVASGRGMGWLLFPRLAPTRSPGRETSGRLPCEVLAEVQYRCASKRANGRRSYVDRRWRYNEDSIAVTILASITCMLADAITVGALPATPMQLDDDGLGLRASRKRAGRQLCLHSTTTTTTTLLARASSRTSLQDAVAGTEVLPIVEIPSCC